MAKNRYEVIIEAVFLKNYREGATKVEFTREEAARTARRLKITLPKNLGDLVYYFRYRAELPTPITERAPRGQEWTIEPAGRGRYTFVLGPESRIVPSRMLAETKIPDATPGVIERYAFTDEQSLFAKVRYNRLVDIFTGLACYSLQNHLRTTVPGMGQAETDELYIGIDKRGAHYILPVQAKGAGERVGIVQIRQDFALCDAKFSGLVARPLAAQFMGSNVIAMFEFEKADSGISLSSEKHYRLVPPKDLSAKELRQYQLRQD